jgi:hypothetical protein
MCDALSTHLGLNKCCFGIGEKKCCSLFFFSLSLLVAFILDLCANVTKVVGAGAEHCFGYFSLLNLKKPVKQTSQHK